MFVRVIAVGAVAATLVLSQSGAVAAQQPPRRQAATAKPAALPSKVTVPIEYHKLENGLKVVLSRDTSSPTAVVGIYYTIGFRIEPKDRTGFAHLFEHMMFQGSRASRQERVHLAGRIERRHPERLDPVRLHQLLPDRPGPHARDDPLGRSRSHVGPEDHPGQPHQPAGRGEERGEGQRPQPAVRRVSRGSTCRSRRTPTGTTPTISTATSRTSTPRRSPTCSSSSRPTTRRTTPCWS